MLRNYLLLEKDFNEKSVDAFIRQFKRTLNYAKLVATDSDGGEEESVSEEEGTLEGRTQMQKPDSIIKRMVDGKKQTIMVEFKNFPLYLTNDKSGALRVPSSLTPEDFELLKKQIDHQLAIVQATSVKPTKID